MSYNNFFSSMGQLDRSPSLFWYIAATIRRVCDELLDWSASDAAFFQAIKDPVWADTTIIMTAYVLVGTFYLVFVIRIAALLGSSGFGKGSARYSVALAQEGMTMIVVKP